MTGRVVVLASINVDRSVVVDRLPAPGQTVLGADLARLPGGKGANQAVAAARAGAAVAVVGAVGDDDDGRWMRSVLAAEGVDVAALNVVDGPTGMAMIWVDRAGENSIVVAPGANGRVDSAMVETQRETIAGADVVLATCEVDVEAIAAAADLCTSVLIVNAAPAMALPQTVWDKLSVLVVNSGELATLAGIDNPQLAVSRLPGTCNVIVTRGSEGTVILRRDGVARHSPARAVSVVDTTGAGDTHAGYLAARLAAGDDLEMANDLATRAASMSVTQRGAQAGIPYGHQL